MSQHVQREVKKRSLPAGRGFIPKLRGSYLFIYLFIFLPQAGFF
jgi:hypothetical protein